MSHVFQEDQPAPSPNHQQACSLQQPEVRNRGSAAKRFMRHLLWAEEGPTAVEYAVMLALIMLACIAGVQALTTETASSFDSSSSAIGAAIGG